MGILRLAGELRSDLVPRLQEASRGLRAEGAKHLIVDLSGLTFVDSASMGALLRIDAETKAAGGKAILFGLPRVALRVLEVTGLSRSFAVAENETAARARIG